MDKEPRVKIEVDVRSRSPSVEPVDLPEGIQDTVDVMCGDAKGVLDIKRARILYEGNDISPTELEKIGGRGASKKWKTSLRVVNPDGKPGPLIGDWLQRQGLDIRHSQLVRYTGKPSPPPAFRPQRPAPVTRPPAAKPQPAVKTQPAAKLPRPGPVKPVQAPAVDLLAHLQSQYIGYIPGDPTVENVPDELPPSSFGSEGVTVIDLDKMSYEELMKMSRESAPDPLGALLPNQPGILPEREAHLTGHQPAKRSRAAAAADANEAAALIGDYMAGRLANPPWQAFGLNREPVICGVDLNLQQLYKAVQTHDGFEATISNKCWGKVAKKLGIDKSAHTNASFVLKNTYIKFLLAYETQARALGRQNSSEDLLDKGGPEEQTKAQSPKDAPSGSPLQDNAPATGSGAASEAEEPADERAGTVTEEASEVLVQTVDASSGAAEEAPQSSRGTGMDDRPPPQQEPHAAAAAGAAEEPPDADAATINKSGEQDVHADGGHKKPCEKGLLNADSDIVDVEMVTRESSDPDCIVLD